MAMDTEEPLVDEPPVIGYSTGGRFIRGEIHGTDGRWLVTFVAGEYVVTQEPNSLDRKILDAGADDTVVVIWKSGEKARRYLARNTMVMSIPSAAVTDDKLPDTTMTEQTARTITGKSDAIIGYDPVDGRLIVGKYRDNRGNWVDALYAGDDVLLVRPTELDRAVLGEDFEWTIVIFRNEWSAAERYRLAPDTSFHCAAREDLEGEEEMLSAAAAARFEPGEGEEFGLDAQRHHGDTVRQAPWRAR